MLCRTFAGKSYSFMEAKKRVIHILWTGGLDSTYRIVELSKRDCVIQPHYVPTDATFRKYELRAIESITSILTENDKTKATFLPLIVVNEKDIPRFPDIQFAWDKLQETRQFKSGQYQMLARYARHNKLQLEIGIQFSKNGSVVKVLDESCLINHPLYDDVMLVDPIKGKENYAGYTLFRDFLFPKSLFHKLKNEEVEELKTEGYSLVLKNVWSCFSPNFGLPCGHCFACRCAKAEGVGYMIPVTGNMLGYLRKRGGRTLRKILPPRVFELVKEHILKPLI